jgi:hypothetical protein
VKDSWGLGMSARRISEARDPRLGLPVVSIFLVSCNQEEVYASQPIRIIVDRRWTPTGRVAGAPGLAVTTGAFFLPVAISR